MDGLRFGIIGTTRKWEVGYSACKSRKFQLSQHLCKRSARNSITETWWSHQSNCTVLCNFEECTRWIKLLVMAKHTEFHCSMTAMRWIHLRQNLCKMFQAHFAGRCRKAIKYNFHNNAYHLTEQLSAQNIAKVMQVTLNKNRIIRSHVAVVSWEPAFSLFREIFRELQHMLINKVLSML